jgi:hypothetical protein
VQLFGWGTLPSGVALLVAVSFKAGGNPTPGMVKVLAAEPSSHATTCLMRRGAPSLYTPKKKKTPNFVQRSRNVVAEANLCRILPDTSPIALF